MLKITLYTFASALACFGLLALVFMSAHNTWHYLVYLFPRLFIAWMVVTWIWVLAAYQFKLKGNTLVSIPFILLFILVLYQASSHRIEVAPMLTTLALFAIHFTYSILVLKVLRLPATDHRVIDRD